MNLKNIIKSKWAIATIAIIIGITALFFWQDAVRSNYEQINIAVVTRPIKQGDVVTKDMIATTQIGKMNIPDDFIKAPDEIIGKYALSSFSIGDFILKDKVADTLQNSDDRLMQLDGTRLAISVSIKSFASGLSDKILAGDIISCFVTRNGAASLPSELTYVEVLTSTMQSGLDKSSGGTETENLATVTLLATPEQARLLAELDSTSEIHLALVYRGEVETANSFLKKQTEVLMNDESNSNNGQ